MREFSFILPIADNDGRLVPGAHKQVREALVQAFGGFTQSSVDGGWRDPKTSVVHLDHALQYVVAADWDDDLRMRLFTIASDGAHKLHQETLYVRDDDGSAFVFDLDAGTVAATA